MSRLIGLLIKHNHITGIKEELYNQFGDLPLEEHWAELLNDETTLCTPYPKGQYDFSDLRKSIIEWIFHLGDKLKQRSLTLQIAIVYIDKLFHKLVIFDIV